MRSPVLLALGLVLLGPGCGERLRPGFCEKPEDCSGGELCDLEGRVAFRRCVAMGDGGADPRDAAAPSEDGPGGSIDPVPGSVDPAAPDASIACGPDQLCPPDRPQCAAGQCVACTADDQCTDPARGACSGNVCVDCRAAGPAACTGAGRVCDPTTGGCAECLESAQCKTPGKSFCAGKVCVGCQEAGPGACQAPTAVCDPGSGACVACTASSSCADPRAPLCEGNRCVACTMAAPGTCASLDPARSVCAPDGACVACNSSPDCTADASKPICLDRVCVGCTSDAQCALKLGANPGVCLRHLGGRCATDAETIYVQDGATCGTAGTSAAPLCTPETALSMLSATREVVVVRGLVGGFAWNDMAMGQRASIIGQAGAVFAGGVRPGVRLSGPGDVYLRGVTVRSSEVVGIVAQAGATLRLDGVVVDTNRGGGILLDGARFDLRDTLVTNNGAGETGAVIWGGILVQAVPAGGPSRLERVSLIDNRQIGLTCDGPVEGVGVHARGNAGGVEVGARCGVTACPALNATCGSSATPSP